MTAADDAVFACREIIAVAACAAMVWVFFGQPGLALALIYAAGYVGERVVSVWGKSLKIPTLAGMLMAGLALRNVPGPWRDLLAAPPRDWLSALRTFATAVIILRAGMSLSLRKMMLDLRGIMALGLLPGACEASLVMVMSRYMLDVSWVWGLMAGFVHAAVSPAVVVPAAIALEDKSLGTRAGVPTRLLSATCIEVVTAIVGFNVCFRIAVNTLDPAYTDDRPPWLQTWMPALEILGGIMGGGLAGVLFSLAMPGCPGWGGGGAARQKRGINTAGLDNVREGAGGGGGEGDRTAAYGIAFWLLLGGGTVAVSYLKSVGFAGGGSLVCVMMAVVCGTLWEEDRKGKSVVVARLNLSWVFVQRALFSAMGAGLDLWSVQAAEAGYALALLGAGVAVRMLVALVVSSPVATGRPLAAMEQAFLAVAWLPKATVQAALAGASFGYVQDLVGDYPDDPRLRDALRAASILQTAGMLSIILTAPLGAMLIAATGPKWLEAEIDADTLGKVVSVLEVEVEEAVQDIVVSLEQDKTKLHITKQLMRLMRITKGRLDDVHAALQRQPVAPSQALSPASPHHTSPHHTRATAKADDAQTFWPDDFEVIGPEDGSAIAQQQQQAARPPRALLPPDRI